jgi:hypothetical protein
MSDFGKLEETIDASRLEPILLDPIIQAGLAVASGIVYLWRAAAKLLQMLKNVDLLLHMKHLIKLLFM